MSDLPPIAPGYEAESDAPAEDVSGCLCNRCVLNRQTYELAISVAMRAPVLRFLRILEPCLMAVSLGMLLWAVLGRRGVEPILFYSLLLAALLYFYIQQFLLYPKKAVRNQLLRQASDYGTDELVNRLYFRDENIANRRGDSDELLHMPYEKIRRVMVDSSMIVLVTRSRNSIPLDPKGFENGSAEDLLALLVEKAPAAKRYQVK